MTIGSLFSGVGGLERGLESCGLGPVVWQAERDPYAYDDLAHHWPQALRFRDVRRIDEHAPKVDLICGGFPCQDISVAGTGRGLDGARSGLWKEFARVVRVLRPGYVFVENSPALRGRGLDRVAADLAALGYLGTWDCFSASDVGSSHGRERIFILAYADRDQLRQLEQRLSGRWAPAVRDEGEAVAGVDGAQLAYADGGRCEEQRRSQPAGLEGAPGRLADGRGAGGYVHRFPPGPDRIGEWDGPQPAVRRGADGLSRRVDRLRCLGNAVVPQVAALAWRNADRARRSAVVSSTGRAEDRLGGENDNFPTQEWCVHRLLDRVHLPRGRWLEPCAGGGAIIRAVGTHAKTTGLVSWDAVEIRKEADEPLRRSLGVAQEVLRAKSLTPGAAIVGKSFLTCPTGMFRRARVVITNPPYGIAQAFVKTCLRAAPDAFVAMLLRLNFYGGDDRSEWLDCHMPDCYPLPNRPQFRDSVKPLLDDHGQPVLNRRTGKPRVVKTSSDSCEYGWFVWPPGAGEVERTEGRIRMLGRTDLAIRQRDKAAALGWEGLVAA